MKTVKTPNSEYKNGGASIRALIDLCCALDHASHAGARSRSVPPGEKAGMQNANVLDSSQSSGGVSTPSRNIL